MSNQRVTLLILLVLDLSAAFDTVDHSDIHPVPIATYHGSWFGSRLSMLKHITKIRFCASSFYYIYIIRRIRSYLSQQSTETLVHAFITTCLDYCNSLYMDSRIAC